MDSWVRSFMNGLLMVALAIGAIMLFNVYEGYLHPYINGYLGIEDRTLLVILLLAFLVGFSLSARREDDDIQDLVRGPNRIFNGPNSRVRAAYEPSEVEEIELVQDAYIAYLQDRIAKLDENQPIVLKIKLLPPTKVEFNFLGRTMPLQRDIVLYYLEALKDFPNFKYVIFVDWFNRFLFFTKASQFRKDIEPIAGTHLIDLINANRVQELSALAPFNPHAVTNHASNMKALRFMANKEISEVMMVSHSWGRRAIGVVELSRLLSVMLAPKRPPKKSEKMKKKPSAQPMYDDERQDPVLASEDDHGDGSHEVVTDDKRKEPIFGGGNVFEDDR